MKHEVNAFFNPTHDGDTYTGLNASIQGVTSPVRIEGIPAFLRAAGRDYWIRRVPALHPTRLVGDTESDRFGQPEILGGQFHLIRSDNGTVVSPKTVSAQYAPMSLLDISEEMQPWCEQGWTVPDGVYGGRFLEDGGESVEILTLRMNTEGIDFPDGETFRFYLCVSNPHGSGGTAKGKIIGFRIICGNTFAAAISHAHDFAVSHRVAKDSEPGDIMKERMAFAVQNWTAAREKIAALAARVNSFQGVKLAASDAADLAEQLLGIKGKKPESVSTRAKNKKAEILTAFRNPGAGTYGETAWDFLNAVTYVNSSPNAPGFKTSRVAPVDRILRTIDPQGTGFAVERAAEKLIAGLV